MNIQSWASTYYLRFLALLGFFLASSSFAASGFAALGVCYPTADAACAGFSANSSSFNCGEHVSGATYKYYDKSGNFKSTMTFAACSYTPTPTPQPTPSPTPDPNIERCEKLRFQWVGSTKDVLFFPSGVTFEQTGSTACLAGCAVMPSEIATGTIGGGEKRVFARGPFMNTGNTCTNPTSQPTDPGSTTGTPVPTPVAPPDLYEDPDFPSCAKGTCPGTLNGQNVCVPCEKTKTESGSTTTEKTKEDGNKEIKEISSETVCNGSVCVTIEREKTTVKDTQGNTVGTPITTETSKTESNDTFCVKNPTHKQCTESNSFCKENPGLSICKSGKFTATCAQQEPTCEGDEIQCAQAKFAFKRYCLAEEMASPGSTTLTNAQATGDFNAALAVANGTGAEMPNETFDFPGGFSLNESNPFSSSCPADRPIKFLSLQIPFSFSAVCPYLSSAGTLLKIFAYFAAGMILFGTKPGTS